MPIAGACDQCGRSYQVADQFAGRRGQCRQCGHVFIVPGSAAASAGPEPVDEYALVEAPAPEPAPARPSVERAKPKPVASREGEEEEEPEGRSRRPMLWAGLGTVVIGVAVMLVIALIPAFREARRRAQVAVERQAKKNKPPAAPARAEVPAPAAEAGLPPMDEDPATRRHEEFVRELITTSNRLSDTVAGVKNLEEARKVTPEVLRLSRILESAPQRGAALPKLTPEQDRRIKEKYESLATASQQRAMKELARYEALADAPAKAAPTASHPILPPGPNEMVVIVSGADDAETRDLVLQELQKLAGAQGQGSSSVGSEVQGRRLVCRLRPVTDPDAVADRITFGAVTRRDGRLVEVAALPARGASPAPAPADFAGRVLFDLKSQVRAHRQDALNRLINAPKGERATEVATALEGILADPDPVIRMLAARALARWGSPENVPALARALKAEPQKATIEEILKTLAALPDPSAAEAIAAVMNARNRTRAAEALVAIGPEAEPEVIKLLRSREIYVRAEACRVLQEIGGKRSLPALRELAGRGNDMDASAARAALRALGDRQGAMPPATKPRRGTSRGSGR